MTETIELSVELRETSGKNASRRLRRLHDKVPAIIYGGDKPPLMVAIENKKVLKTLKNEAFYSSILNITVDGQKETVVLKDLQRHPSNRRILHLDWHRVTENTKITINVPLHIIGGEQASGVKLAGGIITQHITDVSVRCLAKNLPESINMDIAHLELDQILHLSDLPLPTGVELTADISDPNHNVPVVSIHLPQRSKAEEETEEAASAEEETNEPKEEDTGKK